MKKNKTILKLLEGEKIERVYEHIGEGYNDYVWSKSWIIIKTIYNAEEWYDRIPRNPDKEIKIKHIEEWQIEEVKDE